MQIILFDDTARHSLLPFTHTRPVADVRCGIYTMRERWEMFLQQTTSTLTVPYLQSVFPCTPAEDNLLINGRLFAETSLAKAVLALQEGSKLVKDGILIAAHIAGAITDGFTALEAHLEMFTQQSYDGDINHLSNIWDIFSYNDRAIRADFKLITEGRKSAPIPAGIIVTGNDQLFIEEGAHIYPGCVINAQAGPVYIGKDAEVLEGTLIRGPLALCEHSVLKMGAKIYGATTLGPGCKVGGEINNVVFFANSNKSHEGYLGNAVIGEWCNLGADTNCSNLKNNYDEIKIWDEYRNKSVKTGLTFLGLMMGDHSKCGINTMFNTGTVVGVSCNIWGGGFPEKFISSFSWGGSDGMTTYDFNRAMETAQRMMARRKKELTTTEREMYHYVFESTKTQRDLFTK